MHDCLNHTDIGGRFKLVRSITQRDIVQSQTDQTDWKWLQRSQTGQCKLKQIQQISLKSFLKALGQASLSSKRFSRFHILAERRVKAI